MKDHPSSAAPFRVLGIALVVDQRGKEARTVLRYPTSNHQQYQQQQRMHQLAVEGTGAVDYPTTTSPGAAEEEEHLFYKLPGHQMAKLFRPKPPLCGRPMTLSVGGTVFCCCAVLMEDEHDKNSTTTGKKNNKDLSDSGYQSSDEITDDDLILFSVIVALAPHIGSSLSSSIPTAGWMETGYGPGMTTAADLLQGFHSYLDSSHMHPSNDNTAGTTSTATGDPSEKRVSASFLSIRRVHVSLSRLCRILEREERRCRYVSVQANLFDQIRHDLTSSSNNNSNKYSYWQNHHNDTTTISNSTDDADNLSEDLDGSGSRQQHLSPKASEAAASAIVSSALETSSNLANSSHHSSPPLPPPSPSSIPPPPSASSVNIGPTTAASAPTTRHRRAGSNLTVSFDRDTTPGNKNTSTTEYSKKQQLRQEKDRLLELEQVILETCMAAPPTRANVTFSSGGGTTTSNAGENDNAYHSTTTTIEHLGNLARELVQVYHALGRNEHEFPPTPSTLLSGRDGVVYINRHVAFAIETVSTASLSVVDPYFDQRVQVRPYHTLLFPYASPSELLDSMNPISSTVFSSNSSTVLSTPSRRLQQLLRMVHPQKSLTDIAMDAHLPVSTALDLAAYLVGQGAGLASPVITRAIRLATPHGGMARLRRAALPFRQYFHCDCVSLVELVAFLTEPTGDGQPSTLGERLTHLTTAQNDNATVQLREGLRSCWAATTRKHNHPQSQNNNNYTEFGSTSDAARNGARVFASMDSSTPAFGDPLHSIPNGSGGMGVASADEHPHHGEDLEDLLYQMVVWLCSHEVLVQLQDYVIAKFPLTTTTTTKATTVRERSDHHHRQQPAATATAARHDRNRTVAGEHKSDANARLDLGSDDWIVRELRNADCLSGRISIPACCWQTGMDPGKVYQLVARHPQQLRLVTRLPVRGDDWEEL